MSEIDRIRTMAAEGTITRDEADKLIALLEDIDRTEGQVDAVASAAASAEQAEKTPSDATPPDMSRARVDPAEPDSEVEPSRAEAAERPPVHVHVASHIDATEKGPVEVGAGEASSRRKAQPQTSGTMRTPEGLKWLKISSLAGDIDVTVDASLKAPDVDGPEGLTVRDTPEGFEVSFGKGESFFERLMSGNIDRSMRIRVPEGMGIELQLKAGDVDLRGVPYLKGQILAGDVEARGLLGVQLDMKAGDLDLWVTPTEGEHYVNMTAGDVHVRLGSQSDVRVEGRVNIGDARVPEAFESKRRGIGESFRGTVGAGTARFTLSQSTGDAKVSVEHA